MAMDHNQVVTDYFDWLESEYPDMDAPDRDAITKLVELIKIMVQSGSININIPSPTGLVAGGYPLLGSASGVGNIT